MRPSKIVFVIFVSLLLSGLLLATAGFRDSHGAQQKNNVKHERCVEAAQQIADVFTLKNGEDMSGVVASHPEYFIRTGCTQLAPCPANSAK